MRKVLLAATASLSLFAAVAAHAQSNPSAQQLINQLKPSGTVSDTTRGIKPLAPSSSEGTATEAPAATPAVVSSAPSAAPSANLEVDFASGSANLTPRAEATLDQLGKALTSTQLASYNFKIVGHTDTVGDAGTNQTLSEQRAQAVKSYLQSKFGVADTRLQAQGVGESDLAVETPANTPNARNRRVEVINLGQ
ncbi:MAG TPA: OmpA family protein [Acidocella sp.]|jgi:outer membrane protein OmpA-like peptidoglycan-associated protein|nr:OmpA family protein [Acidocella sp.]